MKKIFLLALSLFFSACYINERGISSKYYNDCKEYYDATGVYHKACDENIIDFADAKKIIPESKKNIDYNTPTKEELELDELEKQLEEEEKQKAEKKSEPKSK